MAHSNGTIKSNDNFFYNHGETYNIFIHCIAYSI